MGKLKQKDVKPHKTKPKSSLITIKKAKSVVKLKRKETTSTKLAPTNDEKPAKQRLTYPKVENIMGPNSFNVTEESVKSGIQAVFKLIQQYKSKKSNELFDDDLPIFLQISCIRIPICPVRTMRLLLRNSLFKDSNEICLITANLHDNPRKEHDKTIEHYENLLQSKGINNIKKIMPLHQLKTEYDQYELKRKLITQYDVFLVEGKVSKNVAHLLGKIFKDRRRLPISVKLHVPKLKEHIETSLRKTLMNIHPNGNNFIVQVAHSGMREEEIFENILSALEELAKDFPGGKENIRALYLKSSSTTSIPIYYSLRKACDVKVPTVGSKRPKKFKPMVGTLSTLMDAEISVDPTGTVMVTKNRRCSGDDLSGKEETEENISGKYVRLVKDDGKIKSVDSEAIENKKIKKKNKTS